MQVNVELANMLQAGDFLALTEYFAGLYAETADVAQMQFTDQIFTAIAEIRKNNKGE